MWMMKRIADHAMKEFPSEATSAQARSRARRQS
jgi:hypothetical protein